eukprot:7140754-Prymnesium_polylepis.1
MANAAAADALPSAEHQRRRRKIVPERASPAALFVAFLLATSEIRSALQARPSVRELLIAKDPLSKAREAMQAESAALFARANDLNTGEDVSGAAEMRTDEPALDTTAIDPTVYAGLVQQCTYRNAGTTTAGGTSAGGSDGSTTVASGQPSSEASSEGSNERVVCTTCHKDFPNAHGHSIHCGIVPRCKGAECIPQAQWEAQRLQEALRRAGERHVRRAVPLLGCERVHVRRGDLGVEQQQ